MNEKLRVFPPSSKVASRLLILPLILALSGPPKLPQAEVKTARSDLDTGEFSIVPGSSSEEFARLKARVFRLRMKSHVKKVKRTQPKDAPPKPPVTHVVKRWVATGQRVYAIARQYLGVPYVYGGSTPSGFDCSGFTQFVYRKVGRLLPRTAALQQQVGYRVTEPRIGDLVFWNWPATHVGIYIGGGMFIAAPHSGTSVRIASVYGIPNYRRVL